MLNHGVLFRGILEINRLSWLTERARTRIENDLRQRDIQSRINNGTELRSTSNLTLHFVYDGVRRKVKVLLQGKKNLTAGFLTCKFRVAIQFPMLMSFIISEQGA